VTYAINQVQSAAPTFLKVFETTRRTLKIFAIYFMTNHNNFKHSNYDLIFARNTLRGVKKQGTTVTIFKARRITYR